MALHAFRANSLKLLQEQCAGDVVWLDLTMVPWEAPPSLMARRGDYLLIRALPHGIVTTDGGRNPNPLRQDSWVCRYSSPSPCPLVSGFLSSK